MAAGALAKLDDARALLGAQEKRAAWQ